MIGCALASSSTSVLEAAPDCDHLSMSTAARTAHEAYGLTASFDARCSLLMPRNKSFSACLTTYEESDLSPCGRSTFHPDLSTRSNRVFTANQQRSFPKLDSSTARWIPAFSCSPCEAHVSAFTRSTAGCLSGARRSRFRVLERLADPCSLSRPSRFHRTYELALTNPHEARVPFTRVP